MLTITQPLPTVLDADLLQSNESFANRIVGNYRQMAVWVTPEDMLHLVTQPPEIFMLDGGTGMTYNETNIRNEQRAKVEIVNNVVNRILLAADGHISYQDEVYITNVLHKLGIRDEKTFMKQVYAMTEETRETNELLNTYLNNRESLTELIAEYKNLSETSERSETNVTNAEVLHLHEDVFRRWKAGDVYSSQQQFRYSAGSQTQITKESYHISEQWRLVQQMLLQRLREEVRGEQVPLVYRHENIYEGDDIDNTQVTEASVINRLNSAVLLSMIDNIYQSSYRRIDHSKENIFHVEDTFYEAGDETFERIINNTDYRQALYEDARTYRTLREETANEYETLQQILSVAKAGDTFSTLTEGGDTFTSAQTTYLTQQGDENTQVTEEGDRIAVTNRTTNETEETLLRNLTQQQRIQQTEINNLREGDTFAAGETPMVLPEAEAGLGDIHVDERNTLEQKLYQTNKINLERQQKFMQNLQRISNRFEQERTRRTPEEIRRESLLALEHPEEFAKQVEAQAAVQEERQKRIAEETEKLFPPSTREVFSIIREYMRAPEQFADKRVIMPTPEALFYYDTQVSETEKEREEHYRENNILTERIEAIAEGREAFGPRTEEGAALAAVPIIYRSEEMARQEAAAEAVEGGETVRTEQEQLLIERQRRIIERQQITDRILENIPGEIQREEPAVRPAVRFSYRIEEQGISEDTIKEIQSQVRHNEQMTHRLNEEVKNIATTTEREVNRISNEVVNVADTTRFTEQIAAPRIEPRQINEIAEKVYSKLERQLSSERRRRGL